MTTITILYFTDKRLCNNINKISYSCFLKLHYAEVNSIFHNDEKWSNIKNLAVFTLQDFWSMCGHFSTLWNKGLMPFSLLYWKKLTRFQTSLTLILYKLYASGILCVSQVALQFLNVVRIIFFKLILDLRLKNPFHTAKLEVEFEKKSWND